MKKLLLILSIGLITLSVQGQNATRWIFGRNKTVKIDFTTSPPTPSCITPKTIDTEEGSTTVNKNGGLLFYSDGIKVWDKNHNLMPNGIGLLGDPSSSQSAFTVPFINDPSKYFLFTVGHGIGGSGTSTRQIAYSIVDMTLNGGLGDIVASSKNTVIQGSSGERLTVISNATGNGYWVIIPTGRTTLISVYSLNDAGISAAPTSTFNVAGNIPGVGVLKSSFQQDKIAVGTDLGNVSVCDFNNATGLISNETVIPLGTIWWAYGLEFSANGDYLYFTQPLNTPARMGQIELSTNTIIDTKTSTGPYWGLQMGPDGKIYVAELPSAGAQADNNISAIVNPEVPNALTNHYTKDYLTFCGGAGGVYRGLPSFIPTLFQQTCNPPTAVTLTASATDFCDGGSVILTAGVQAGFTYQFLDAANNVLQTGTSNTYTVTSSGTYKVKLISTTIPSDVSCQGTSATVTVTEHNDPAITGQIKGKDNVCLGESGVAYILDDPNLANYSSINWQTLSSGSYGTVNNENVTVNFPNATGNIDIKVIVKETHGTATCTSAIFTKTVTVKPNPTVNLSPTSQNVACNSKDNLINITNFNGNNTYTITGAANTLNGDKIKVNVSQSDVTINVKVKDQFGCVNTNSATMDVKGCGLNADFTVTQNACSGTTVTFDASASLSGIGTTITNYNWTFPSSITPIGNTNQAVVTATVSNTGTTQLIEDVKLIVTNSISMTDQEVKVNVINVNPLPPTLTITNTAKVCEGEDAIFKVTPYDANSTYVWTATVTKGIENADSLSITNGPSSYTVTVQETNKHHCVGTVSSINVSPETTPVISLATTTSVACNSTGNTTKILNPHATSIYTVLNPTNVANVVVNAATGIITFDALTGNGHFTIKEVTKPNNCKSGTVKVTVTTTGCGLNASFTVTQNACSGTTVTFDASASVAGNGATITNYNWTFPSSITPIGNTNKAIVKATVSNTGTTQLIEDVTLIITNSSGLTDKEVKIKVIKVNPLPPTLTITNTAKVCEGKGATFKVNPYDVNSTYAWTSDNPTLSASSTSDSATAINGTNNYTVKVTETNKYSCVGAEALINVIIEKNPVINIATSITAVCNSVGNKIKITNYNPISTYTVVASTNVANVIIGPTGTIIFDALTGNGSFTIQEVTNPNSCTSASVTINVITLGCGLNADFEADITEICHGDTVIFTDLSDPGAGANIVTYNWTIPSDFTIVSGSGTSVVTTIANNTGTTPIIADISLQIITNDPLTDKEVKNSYITINPNPATISIDKKVSFCEGEDAIFKVIPYDAASNYVWTATTTIKVKNADSLSITNGTSPYTVTVVETNKYGCVGTQVSVTATPETTPVISLATTTSVACNSTGNTTKILNPHATSIYTVLNPTNVANVVVNAATGIITFDALTGNGHFTIKEVTKPNNCKSGTVKVTVTTTGCGLNASFTVTQNACSGTTVTFDASASVAGNGATITNYNWTFPSSITPIGNTNKAIVKATVSNTGTTQLIEDVTLIITNSSGLTDKEIKIKVIKVNPLPPTLTLTNTAKICEGKGATFKVNPYDVNSTYAWTSDNPTLSASTSDSATAINGTSNYTVKVVETNKYSCVGAEASIDVTVEPTGTIDVVATMDVVCASKSNTLKINNFDPSLTYDTVSTLNVENVVIDNTLGIITFDATVNQGSIVLEAISLNSCKSNQSTTIVNLIGCGLGADFTTTGPDFCSGDTIVFDGTSSNPGQNATVAQYLWTFPSNITLVSGSTKNDPIVTAIITNTSNLPDSLDVTLEIISSTSLTADTTKVNIVTVGAVPVNPIIHESGGDCPGDTSVFTVTPLVSGITPNWSSSSNIGIYSTSSDKDSIKVINGSDSFSVSVYFEDDVTSCISTTTSSTKTIKSAPTITSIIAPDKVCPSVSANSKYDLIALTNNADSLAWSSSSSVNFLDINNDTTAALFNVFNDTIEIIVEAFNASCDVSDIATLKIFVDTSYFAKFHIVDPTVCLGDTGVYTVKVTGGVPPDSLISYQWFYNGNYISDTTFAVVDMVNKDDSLKLVVTPKFCYDPFVQFADSIALPFSIRPGGKLEIGASVSGTYTISNSNELVGEPTLGTIDLFDTRYSLINPPPTVTDPNPNPTGWEFIYWLPGQIEDSAVIPLVSSLGNFGNNFGIGDVPVPSLGDKEYDITYGMVTHNDYCTDTVLAKLHVRFDWFIPTVFTPNADGFYDTWQIENSDKYGPLKVQIFNRWGNLVYSDNNYANNWSGTNMSGEKLPFGTYFYIVNFPEGGDEPQTGSVSILK